MADRSLPAAYFEALYAENPDPWQFANSDYERDKYAATLAALPAPGYARALEIGCSIGVLTAQLARRCDALVAVDVAEAALTAARIRCVALPVTFHHAQVPDGWPRDMYDLIVLSEVLYYLDTADLAHVAALTCRDLSPGGAVVMVHFTDPTNYPQSGDDAADGFIRLAGPALAPLRADRHARYRLDVLTRRRDA